MCRRISPRTSELTNPIAAPGRCSKPTTGLPEVQSEKKEGTEERRNERKHHEDGESKEGPVPIERGGFEKRGKRRGCALTNRMAKETRRFYRRSDRIYEYGHHQSFVSRKRDTRGVRLVSLCD